MPEVLIKTEQLSKHYLLAETKTEVLAGIDLTINKGEFVSIMGPSGSGKSTLMHILGLLDLLSTGKYYFAGQDVSSLSDAKMSLLRNKEIGFVFQAFNLLARTTVLDNVKLPLIYSDDKTKLNERAQAVLTEVGLAHRLDHYTNQISGGEKQRVAIARALVNQPSVIFADEPTGNLDSKSGQQILALLQQLHQKGHTIILVTHETQTAQHAQRIIRLLDGRVVADEAVAQRRIASDQTLYK